MIKDAAAQIRPGYGYSLYMIEIDSLTKNYGHHTVVDNLTFKCEPGEVLGFLGPNGAGKSTTMKMITGFVAPTSGRASVCGHDIEDDALAARRRLGYLPEGAPCYPEMTPASFLNFVADLRELSGSNRKERLDDVIGKLHLGSVLNQTIDTLSKGFRRRVGLAQAILHDPDVLILDEPTDGLDPNQKYEVRELLRSMAEDKLIVISTHSPQKLAAGSRYHNAVRIVLADGNNFDEVRAAVGRLSSVETTESDRDHHTITAIAASGQEPWRDVSDLVAEKDWPIASVQLEAGRLDEVFRQITGGAEA